jgi:hypothetical protein
LKTLNVPGTQTLQATLRAHNKVLGQEAGLWATLTMKSSDTERIMNAREQVKAAFQDWLTANPSSRADDTVKAWLVDNAREPDKLIARLNASY